ncbi:MAG: hypothetical protein AAGI30_06990 [Planctomycetota bacterium]
MARCHRVVAAIAVVPVLCLGGCYSVIDPISVPLGEPVRYPVSVSSASAHRVFSSPQVVSWSAASRTVDAQRFEFSRRDALMGVQRSTALRATAQWPHPLRPLERPVDFDRFRQDD